LPTLGVDVELLYVDFGSTDDTLEQMRKIVMQPTSHNLPKKLIALRRYTGTANAFIAAVEHSNGRFLLTLDVALTVDPIESLRMIEEIELGYDLVSGWRQRGHLPLLRRWRSRIVNAIASRLTGVYLHDYGTPFRLFRREMLNRVRIAADLYAFSPVFAHLSGAKISEIKVAYRPDYYIRPEYTTISFISSFFDMLTLWYVSRYAHRPIGLLGKIGLLFVLIATVLFLAAWVNQPPDIRNTLIILSGLSAIAGIQSIMMGLNLELLLQKNYASREAILSDVIETVEAPLVSQGEA
jgi:glycosyltransferase involved in cell wall biosynthesis